MAESVSEAVTGAEFVSGAVPEAGSVSDVGAPSGPGPGSAAVTAADGLAEDLFAGTAADYAAFRPAYPAALLERVRAAAAPGSPSRLVDLGCGTGELAVPLSAYVDECRALDVSPEMLRHGRERARRAGRANIEWTQAPAEALELPDGSVSLVTVGAAFHWMDRRLVGARALRWLRPGGSLVVAGSNSTWNGTEDWQKLAVEVIQRWLGPRRRAGGGTFRTSERHEDALRAVGFTDLADVDFPAEQTWTVDAFLGYLRSTSFASAAVLGDRQAAFEQDMRETLDTHEPSGVHRETVRFHCLLARRPV